MAAGGLALAAALLSACGAERTHIRAETPLVVEATPSDGAPLASLDPETLLARGREALAAGWLLRAARAFDTYRAGWPEGPHLAEATLGAGQAWEGLGEFREALARYEAALAGASPGPERRVLVLRSAECLYHLEAFAAAAERLHALAEAPDTPPEVRIQALVQEGICRLEAGDEAEAEHRLRQGVGRYHLERRRGEAPIPAVHAAQGQFFLGELYRLRAERVGLGEHLEDPEALAEALERKADLLLSAQGHYLRTVRMGNRHWGTAAAFRVGRLYEVLYEQLLATRTPQGLDDDARRAYLALLRRRIQVLLDKAMAAYEGSLEAAERLGVEGPWRVRIEAGFARVQRLLLEDGVAHDAHPG